LTKQQIMIAQLRPALISLLLLTLLTGVLYPLAITGIAQAAFPYQATSSVIMHDGVAVGSELIWLKFRGYLGTTAPAPVDLVTSNGLNPHTGPAVVEYQVSRVAYRRDLNESAVRERVA
jgi:potassium-transporting ATPase KdpC subunit